MLKVLNITFYLLLISYFNTNAQKFNGGILAGLSTSQVDGDHLAGFNHVGIKAGAFVNRNFSRKLALQFELEFIQKGSRKPLNIDDNSYYLLRLNYVEAPLMLKYFIAKKWIIEGGPSMGVLLSAHEEDENPNPFHSTFHKYDFLVNGGASYMLSEKFSVNIRYSYSIVPIRFIGDDPVYYYLSGDQYNSVLAFGLEYQF